jgi:RND family efflux transporter MFP subunit
MNTKQLLRIGWKAGLILIIASAIIYRFKFAPIPVESGVAKMDSIASEVMGTGTLEARVQATISAKIQGRLSDVLADQGDRVTKGQLLATLDDADFCQQVEMAKAEIEAVKAGVDRAAADVNSVQATAVHARAFYNRVMPLAENKVVSEEDLDNALQKRDVAEAQLRRAELAKVEMERQLAKAEATLQYYEEKLADTKLFAPFDALVIRRDRDPGAIIVPGSSILQIISTEQIWVSAWVDESAMAQLAVDQPARVVFRTDPAQSYEGTVARISPLADRETREFLVDVLVKELPSKWAVGQRAEVYIRTASKDNVLLVPSKAVVWQKGKPGLFISNDGNAKWVNIEIGLQGKESVEISSGLKVGDIVIWSKDTKKAITENRAVRLK